MQNFFSTFQQASFKNYIVCCSLLAADYAFTVQFLPKTTIVTHPLTLLSSVPPQILGNIIPMLCCKYDAILIHIETHSYHLVLQSGQFFHVFSVLFFFSDGKYRRKQVSIQYRYFGKVSILRYPSENNHHELHIHMLVTYFDVFQLSDFEFFRFLRHLPHFPVFSILDFFFCIFGHYSSDNTKYGYLYNVSILNDTKRYRYGIDSMDTISHYYFF